MNRAIVAVIIAVISILVLVNLMHSDEKVNLKLERLKQEYALKPVPSVDHNKLPALQRTFNSPQEVTEACISCHTERHKEVMASSHWNWSRVAYIEGRGIEYIGKANVINNYCIGARTNEQACAKCHIGFGMTNDHFDFTNARNVDCMVCHDNSEEYLKGSAMAGYPARSVNLTKVAQNVGSPEKMNCGACHFYSGGGNNVKHGDLEEALLATERNVDVHMAANGMDMSCVACHTAENHQMLGKLYSVSSENVDRATCQQCHTSTPHFDDMLNRHNARVSCQTCHIPHYAKENPTKMAWNWSDAGKLKEGQPYHEDDSLGKHTYLSIKGSFTWEKNVEPDYVWFNGTADHYLMGDTISQVPVKINTLHGWHDDPESKIIPVKIHKGDQIYDKINKTLIQPKLYAEQKGDSAYWKDFDWNKAAAAGMKRVGLPYSGEYGFVETEMYWPVNHMVSPAEKALKCADCHTRDNGRLAQLTGFYLPGRDFNKPVDTIGTWLLRLAIVLIIAHTIARIVSAIRNKGMKSEVINQD
ncbi:MAG: tetrathionate reductase family octaheme c-type cytochrome [Bacteroidetes bacterium]|jgi:octaheme c-type cytochrome (tetrathionate reductase family)|nr:tetrathionate reductase family octaheme c-type cytochrome [Bacteroidota bacterium]